MSNKIKVQRSKVSQTVIKAMNKEYKDGIIQCKWKYIGSGRQA